MTRLRTALYILFILAIIRTVSKADDHGNARGKGMAHSSMVTSYGIDAFGLNPANYDFHLPKSKEKTGKLKEYQNKPRWEISLLSLGGSYGSDSSLDFYNNYLKYLSVNRSTFTNLFTDLPSVLAFRDSVLPGQQTQVNYDFELKWFSLNLSSPKFGAFNITIADKVGLNTNAYSKDQEMPLNFIYTPKEGGKYDLVNVNLNQSEATAWWLRKYSIGYAKQFDFNTKSGIKNFSIGASIALVNGFGNIVTNNTTLNINSYGIKATGQGYNHVDSIKGKQNFYTESALTDFFSDYNDGAKSHFNFFPKPAGTGYSMDLGINMQIGNAWRFAASVTDIGKVTWNYHTFINNDTNHFIYKNFNLVSTDPTYNRFVNDLEGLDTRDSLTNFTTNMPTKYRVGLAFEPSEKFLLEFNWIKGDNNLPGNSTANIFALGTEYYPLVYLPLRTGISIGGPGDYFISFGTGLKLKYFVMDLGVNGINQIIQSKRLSFALSAKLIL